MPAQIIIGEPIKHFGPFSLRTLSVRTSNGLVSPTNRYQISFEQTDAERIELVSIEIDKSELSDVLQCLYDWLRGQRFQIEQAKQLLNEVQDSNEHEALQALLERWTPRYRLVVNALLQLDPLYDAECDLIAFEKRRTTTIGDSVKRYGRFVLRDIIEADGYGTVFEKQYQISLEREGKGEFVLGSVLTTKSDLPSVLSFIYEWIEAYQVVIAVLEKRLKNIQDDEDRAASEAFLEMHRHALRLVKPAFDEIKQGHN